MCSGSRETYKRGEYCLDFHCIIHRCSEDISGMHRSGFPSCSALVTASSHGDFVSQEEEACSQEHPASLSSFSTLSTYSDIYCFEAICTDVKYINHDLRKQFPMLVPDFYAVRKFLTSEMSRLDFFINNNQFLCGEYIMFDDTDGYIRMRVPVRLISAAGGVHKIYHPKCVPNNTQANFALLNVISRNICSFNDTIADHSTMFFCAGCDYFLYEDVTRFTKKMYEIPPIEVYPKCPVFVQGVYSDDEQVMLFAQDILVTTAIANLVLSDF